MRLPPAANPNLGSIRGMYKSESQDLEAEVAFLNYIQK